MLNYSSKTFSTYRAWFGLEFVTSDRAAFTGSLLPQHYRYGAEGSFRYWGWFNHTAVGSFPWQGGSPWPSLQGRTIHHLKCQGRASLLRKPTLLSRLKARGWVLEEKLSLSWLFLQSPVGFLFVQAFFVVLFCFIFLFRSCGKSCFVFLHEILLSAHHGNGQTVNLLTLWEGPWEENGRVILNQPFYPICISVSIYYFKDKNLWQLLLLTVFQQVWSQPGKARAVQLFLCKLSQKLLRSFLSSEFQIWIRNTAWFLKNVIVIWQSVSSWDPRAALSDGELLHDF